MALTLETIDNEGETTSLTNSERKIQIQQELGIGCVSLVEANVGTVGWGFWT
jgi:hypothetical protein